MNNILLGNNLLIDVSGMSGAEIAEAINNQARRYTDYDENLTAFVQLNFRKLTDPTATRTINMRYSLNAVRELGFMIDHPLQVWNEEFEEVGSDVRYTIFEDKELDEVMGFFLESFQFYRENFGSGQHRGAFFPYLLTDLYKTSNTPEAVFIKEELERIAKGEPSLKWMEDYQLLFFESEDTLHRLLSEKNEDDEEVPILDECLKTPCLLWAVKGQITEEDYNELERTKIIYGTCTRTSDFTSFLKKKGYSYFIAKTRTNNTKFKQKEEKGRVNLIYCEGHWMKKGIIWLKYNEQRRSVSLYTFLNRCIEQGLFRKMTTHEVACIFENRSFAAFDNVDRNIERTFDTIPEDTLVEVPDDWVNPMNEKRLCRDGEKAQSCFNPNKNFPKRVVFFDFEADTTLAYHKPYLVSAICFDLKDDGTVDKEVMEMTSWWGENCAKAFMNRVYDLAKGMKGNKKGTKKIRLYAYNAGNYDLNFIMPYMKQIKVCQRGEKIYSAEGIFYRDQARRGENTTWIQVWDAYLLFGTSLRNAARATNKGGFLKPEQAQVIKKEMFPYTGYTFKFFEEYKGREWAPVEDMECGFMEQDNDGLKFLNQKKYDEFILTLKHTLPFIPEYSETYCEGKHIETYKFESPLYKTFYRIATYTNQNDEYTEDVKEETTGEFFNFREYAKFYCEQDVRCLYQIMFNMEDMCMGRDLDGVQGTVPFKIHIWNHRTASAIGYDNLQMNVLFMQDEEGNWVPRHDFYAFKNEGRALIQKSIRGGRVMPACNMQWRFYAEKIGETYDRAHTLQDCDANSLYPSTMATLLWITEGKPSLLKGEFTHETFKERFTHPWAPEGKQYEKLYNDGIIHMTYLNCKKSLHIPRLCIKDNKTKLNDWDNWNTPVDTWVNAKDAWDLIDHQDAEFIWDKALVFTGKRCFEIQEATKKIYNFRKPNKKLGVGNVAKLMMNSSYGKSTLKMRDEEIVIIDQNRFEEFFKANAYRIKKYEKLQGKEDPNVTEKMAKYKVVLFCKDLGATFNMFGSNVLAGSKCIMQRVTSLIEEVAEEEGYYPHIYYTDTDSTHVVGALVDKVAERFEEKYGFPLLGGEVGQFHGDFDPIADNENTIGAIRSIFIMKKVYIDELITDKGTIGCHIRMKGVPGNCLKFEDYEALYDGETITVNILGYGRCSIRKKGGGLVTVEEMKRKIKGRLESGDKRPRDESEIETECEDDYPAFKLPRCDATADLGENDDDDPTEHLPTPPPTPEPDLDQDIDILC